MPPCVVLQLVDTVLQGQGIWRMHFQGLEMPLLKLDTIIEHGDGQIAAEDGCPVLIIIEMALPQRGAVTPIASSVGMRASSRHQSAG